MSDLVGNPNCWFSHAQVHFNSVLQSPVDLDKRDWKERRIYCQDFVSILVVFNLYINDLVDTINSTNKGIDIDGERVAALLYADDLFY